METDFPFDQIRWVAALFDTVRTGMAACWCSGDCCWICAISYRRKRRSWLGLLRFTILGRFSQTRFRLRR